MTYNLTNVTDANNLFGVLKATNDLTTGYLGLFILISVSIALFMVFKKQESDTTKSLLVSSFITLIIGVLLWGLEIIGFNILFFPLIMLFASMMMLIFGGG